MKSKGFITGIRSKIEAGDIEGANYDLHHILISKDFMNLWGRNDLPVMWGYISTMKLDSSCPTAMVDLRNGKVFINPQFILDKILTIEDLLFIILHERDHRLIRRIYRIDWYRLRKILDFKDEWVSKVRNSMEDAWINASVRSSTGIFANLPEQYYCWTQENAENPEGSGFNASEHTVGLPKSEEYALLTCLSPSTGKDIQEDHEGLYVGSHELLRRHNVPSLSRHSKASYLGNNMLSFPEWYEVFCNWLEQHKDDMALPSPGSEHDEDCPQAAGEGEGGSGSEGEDEGSEGAGSEDGEGSGSGSEDGSGSGSGSEDGDGSGNKPCTCNGGNGLFDEPMTLAERLARIPDLIGSKDDIDKVLDDAEHVGKDPKGQDHPSEVFEIDGDGVSWGGALRKREVVPKKIQDLDDFDRGLLEMGGSFLTESNQTNTVQIKGAIKQTTDDFVQNIASMRVTENKFMRPDPNIPMVPSRRNMMQLGMGHMPVMWDHVQYLEQQELVVYTDVSGSMNWWYSVALYLTKQLREFGCESYQFSTKVAKPVPGRDDNVFWSTGGTDFNTVAGHIKIKGFKSVIIITDNEDALSEENTAFLRDEIPELYLVFLQDGTRPRDLDPLTYNWGGRYGAHGFQRCTENITGIFRSDTGK
jgi:hypothetical protein